MRDFQTISDSQYDVLIIGGGINGAATARDAALRGLKPILLEKNDFASGTSSWSTRLIHGGLRYLEYFEFKLVRESLRERELLLEHAPHLVHPVQLTIPIYRRGARSYWEIQAGMLLYDLLSYDKTVPAHRMLTAKKFQQLFRAVDDEGLKGAAQYYDGQAEYAERLCLENILGAKMAGATVLNYVTVTALHRDRNRITHLTCVDELTGKEFTVRGTDNAVVINTAGPWVDQVCQRGEENHTPISLEAKRLMGGTKGSHIVVSPFPGAPDTAFYVEAKSDNRPFFIVPWLGMYLIGTTDIRFEGDLERIKANNDEIDYLLYETNRIFPAAQLTRSDVRFTYSGVRPLPYTEGQDTGSITRKHILHEHGQAGVSNLISLIGGKLTTFRQVGEELVDAVYRKQGRTPPPCPTCQCSFPGAIWPDDPQIEQVTQQYADRLSVTTVAHLFTLYGSNAPDVLALTDQHPDLLQSIVEGFPDIRAQIVYAVQQELAHTYVDILRRRTTLAMQANYGLDLLPVLGDTLKQHCGWSQADCDRNIEQYWIYIRDNCLPDYLLQSDMAQRELQILP